MPLPKVAIVGRPNVGKSALFNRIVGRRVAIVDRTPGVTRDRLYAEAEWDRARFILIDTGGIVPYPDEPLLEQVKTQAEVAIAEAVVILLVVDAMDGLTPLDHEVAGLLRPVADRTLCVVNKCDNEDLVVTSGEFHALGFPALHAVSALHGLRVGPMLDEVVRRLPAAAGGEPEAIARIAVVGRPNVGKSTFINALLDEPRLVVDGAPGTTRDAVDVVVIGRRGERYVLVDTAGIRRKRGSDDAVEKYSLLRAEAAIERADVAMLILDGSAGVTSGDARIARLVEDKGRGCVLVVNKWDLVKETTQRAYTEVVYHRLDFMRHCPVLTAVATSGKGVWRALGSAAAVFEQSRHVIPTPELNKIVQAAQADHTAPIVGRGRLRVYYLTQTGTQPPQFLLFVNHPKRVTEAYLRYLANRIRAAFPFAGTPLRLTPQPHRQR